jgi:DNA-binding XRE family transcriptional regulator
MPKFGVKTATAPSLLQSDIIQMDKVADQFGVSRAQLADTIGVRRETLNRVSRAKSPKTQARIREMLEIIARIKDWAGGELQAFSWYRAYSIPAFGDRTAEMLVKEGRAAEVRQYLDHIALGGFE